MKMFKKNNKGFTLVELLVVIAIIAILAAVIAPNAFKAIEKSKVSAIVSDYRAVKIATLVYYSDTGNWPQNKANKTGFVTAATATGHTASAGWNGPYLDAWIDKSPLGTGYEFVNVDGGDEVSLKVKGLPESAHKKLIDSLGTELVSPSTASGVKDVELLIAHK